MIDFATHVKGNILDLVLTNAPERIMSVTEEGRLGHSDHFVVQIDMEEKGEVHKEEQDLVLNWKRADWAGMVGEMGERDWEREMEGKNVTEAWQHLKEVLDRITEKHVPKRKRRSQNRPQWMTKEIMKMIRKKRRLWKRAKHGEDAAEYREAEKRLKKMIRNAKRNFEKRLSEEKDNKRPFYSYVKVKTKSRQAVGPLKGDQGEVVGDNKGMAELLNKGFCKVFNKKTNERVPDYQFERAEHKMTKMVFRESDIKKKIDGLKQDSAPGPDGIRPVLLKNLKKEVAEPLRRIFEKSMGEGKIPDDWRGANITPIYKKGRRTDTGNYRPVALTAVCSKLMESLVRDEITAHLDKNDLLKNSQHGFRKKMSCTTNLLEFFETVTATLDEGHPMDLVFLDLAKAFDKVPHSKLIQKLEAKRVSEEVVKWVEDWLRERKQRVVLNGKCSEWGEVESGVIQGTVLGPPLFTIYIDDIDEALKKLTAYKKFADDTKLGQRMGGEEDRIKLQEALNKLMDWAAKWNMEFNLEKCKVMHTGTKNPAHEYEMAGRRLEVTEEEKDIGVVVTKNLRPGKQCAKAAQTARAVLGQITRAFHYRDKRIFKNLYVQYVRPHLEFAGPAWAPWTQEDMEILEKVQRKAVGMMSGLKGQDYGEKLKEIGLDSLQARREDADLTQTFKIMGRIDKVDPETWFRTVGQRGQRDTRATADRTRLQNQRTRTEMRRHFFSNRVVEPWNRLPQEIREVPNVHQFKKQVLKLRRTADTAH